MCGWFVVQQMYDKPDDPPLLMCVRRDHCAHLPRRHSNDDSIHGNELPAATTSLDDMIDALDHDISHIAVVSSDSSLTGRDTQSPSLLSFQILD